MSKTKELKLPTFPPRCVICGERVLAPPFVASKPRKGTTIYAHTACLEQEQKENDAK